MEIVVDPGRCMACRSCEVACALGRDSVSRTVVGALGEDPVPRPRVSVRASPLPLAIPEALGQAPDHPAGAGFPLQCRHCLDAPCLDACPTGAMYRPEPEGAVLYDEAKCMGCLMCVAACPFGAVKPGHGGRVLKCDRCTHMEYPFCVDACPTGALQYRERSGWQGVAGTRQAALVKALALVWEGGAFGENTAKENG